MRPGFPGRLRKRGFLGIGFAATALAALLMFAPGAVLGVGLSSDGSPGLSSTCHATITQVSGLTIKNIYHRIVIIGTCFGTHPTLVPVSSFAPFNGTDTKNCGNGKAPPTMSIGEWGSKSSVGDWSAGRMVESGGDCSYGDSIGLTYTSWSETKIVIGHGFGNALGTSTQNIGAPYQMTPHAQCSVYFRNPANTANPANYTLPRGTC
jgi:hypothetical protein